jgi:carboxylesterase type B
LRASSNPADLSQSGYSIHGGGYVGGSAPYSYPGDALVNQSIGNIIYVGIQYRLGMFGFMGGDTIAQNGALNAGLLDQRAAMDWVQRNIRAFGGDPTRVTIWGGSAGGGSVSCQLIANGASDFPPFAAAIADHPWWQPFANQSIQNQQYNTALRLSGCSDIHCLRSLSSAVLGNLNQVVINATYPGPDNGYGVYYWGPVVDGKFIRDLPDQEFARGNFYKMPLITNRDAYEGVIFSNKTQSTQTDETVDVSIHSMVISIHLLTNPQAQDLFPSAGPSFFSRLYSLYPRSAFNSTFFQRQTWFGDFIINCPTYQMASSMVDALSNSSAVFKLTFAAGSELHGATNPFISSNVTNYPSANNLTLAHIMTSYWVSFVVNHDPNPSRIAGAPYWPSYISGASGTTADGQGVGFTVQAVTYNSIIPGPDPDASARCDFFGSRGWQVRN